MKSLEIRQKFFDFFIQRGHTHVPSSSLIPAQDPTLLFTNAGMNQFKDVFLGKETRSYTRAVSIQKCIRAGGKHNDLENVGFTKRHLTFFEMMGNFSFGDYFKRDAIIFAWDFLTKEVKLPADKLYASVYYKDDEAYTIWHKDVGLSESKIVRLGEKDNFWQMGDSGPCGPCSEIYIDRGSTYGCEGQPCAPGCHCDRFLEIWNLVFMQYDRQPDGSDKPLKQTGVDTGMGLERLCATLQNKDSVFDTDLFAPLITATERLAGVSYCSASGDIQAAFRVLADHIRSSVFAIADGCTPSNEGRGYVLRKIIRRAALFAQKLHTKNIFPDLAPILIESMSSLYPELQVHAQLIVSLLRSEVEKFSSSLIHGQQILHKYFVDNKDSKVISGEQAFKLYDTYGFPLELTNVIAHEQGFSVDTTGFEKHMEQQRIQSGKKQAPLECTLDEDLYTHFTGYEEHVTHSTITALLVHNKPIHRVEKGTLCSVITEHSPFYVECGGQISDEGFIKIGDTEAKLLGLKKIGNTIAAEIEAPTVLHKGDLVTLVVDSPSRTNTMKNHTATHLLQAALISILGKGVKQSGSVVTPDYLRFDFTYHENLTAEQINEIESIVNNKIMHNIPLKIEQTTLQEALNRGVIAFFGEKYNPEKVRVVEVPGFSAELCGGTHVRATGDIGIFKIIEVTALSAGNRRLVAVTGPQALALFQQTFSLAKHISQEFKVPFEGITQALQKQKEQLKNATMQAKEVKKQLYKVQMPQWITQIQQVGKVPFLYLPIPDATPEELRDIAQEFIKAQPGLYFLITQTKEKAFFFTAVASQIASYVPFKEFTVWLRTQGLQGGGSGTSMQGGAFIIDLDLEYNIKQWVRNHAM